MFSTNYPTKNELNANFLHQFNKKFKGPEKNLQITQPFELQTFKVGEFPLYNTAIPNIQQEFHFDNLFFKVIICQWFWVLDFKM